MTTTEEPFPTKPRSKLFDRYSWLPLAMVLVVGGIWAIGRFRTHKLQAIVFGVAVVLLLGIELLRWFQAKKKNDAGVSESTFVDATSSFCVALIFSIASAMLVIPLLYSFADWLHGHQILHVNDRLNDAFGGAGPFVIFVLLIVLVDFAYYWDHRTAHTVELFWANHSVHHSSEHFNPTTSVRISFLDEAWDLVLVSALALLGFPAWALFSVYGLVLLYQAPLHVNWKGRFPKPIEYVFNTPEHHRAHHARQKIYIDKNFSGVFILWDRIFGSYAEVEDVNPLYGLTIPVGTFRIMPILFHENVSLARKMLRAKSFGTAIQYPFRRPYWEPAGD